MSGPASSRRARLALAVGLSLAASAPSIARADQVALRAVDVVLPDADNRQHLSFWVAQGAGLFAARGLAVTVRLPPGHRAVLTPLREGTASVAVLPPPMYLEAMGEGLPIVLVANLLTNDPINLIVRRSVVEARHVPLRGTVAERLRALGDIRIGIAPNPPPRLRALYAFAGVPLDEAQIQVIGGRRQNEAFRAGEVDALYAHTPFLETALLEDDAVIVVNQSAGGVPPLDGRVGHALAVTKRFAAESPSVVRALVEALVEAQALVRRDEPAAVAALAKVLPVVDPRRDALIVGLYAPALPSRPQVPIEGVLGSLALFPETRRPPALTRETVSAFVDNRFADEVMAARTSPRPSRPPPRGPLVFAGIGSLALLALALATARILRRHGAQR